MENIGIDVHKKDSQLCERSLSDAGVSIPHAGAQPVDSALAPLPPVFALWVRRMHIAQFNKQLGRGLGGQTGLAEAIRI